MWIRLLFASLVLALSLASTGCQGTSPSGKSQVDGQEFRPDVAGTIRFKRESPRELRVKLSDAGNAPFEFTRVAPNGNDPTRVEFWVSTSARSSSTSFDPVLVAVSEQGPNGDISFNPYTQHVVDLGQPVTETLFFHILIEAVDWTSGAREATVVSHAFTSDDLSRYYSGVVEESR